MDGWGWGWKRRGVGGVGCGVEIGPSQRGKKRTAEVFFLVLFFCFFTKTLTSISQYQKQRKYTAEKEDNKIYKDRKKSKKKATTTTTTKSTAVDSTSVYERTLINTGNKAK